MASDSRPGAKGLRPIRSYVLRQGRLTTAQKQALSEGWPRYGVDPSVRLDPDAVFGRAAPLILEIGFGNGEALAALAQAEPDKNFIGVEVHQPGVGHLLRLLDADSIDNVRVVAVDAVEWLQARVPDACLLYTSPSPRDRQKSRMPSSA